MEGFHQPINRRTIAGLAWAGFISGTLSVIALEVLSSIPRLQELRLVLFVPGAVFGVIVSSYYAIFLRIRAWARLLSLIAASIGAYFLAVQLSVYALVGFRELDWSSRPWSFNGALFLGGMVGAFVMLTTAQLLLSTRRKWRAVLGAAILWSLAGGALGVAGWALGGSVGKLFWLALHAIRLTMSDASLEAAVSSQNVNMYSLLLLWQAAMAPVLGWLISKGSAAQAEHQSAASSA
jgi:hypothetical protein